MSIKFKQTPYSFSGTNISAMKVALDLINLWVHSGSHPIPSFVYVLVNILHRSYRGAYFHIDVGIIAQRKVGAVGNDPTIIHSSHNCTPRSGNPNGKGLPTIPPAIEGIAIGLDHCLLLKLTGISLVTGRRKEGVEIFHAERMTIASSTLGVNHCGLDDTSQLLARGIIISRKLSWNKAVNVGSSQELRSGPQEEQKMKVWEASLLVLDCPNPSLPIAKDILVFDLIKQIT